MCPQCSPGKAEEYYREGGLLTGRSYLTQREGAISEQGWYPTRRRKRHQKGFGSFWKKPVRNVRLGNFRLKPY